MAGPRNYLRQCAAWLSGLAALAFVVHASFAHLRCSSVPGRVAIDHYPDGTKADSESAGSASDVERSVSSEPLTRIYVISLDGAPGADRRNIGRMNDFRNAWAKSCPGAPLVYSLCPGIMHPLQGHGLTIAYMQCAARAIEDNAEAAFFLEDDARLEAGPTAQLLCDEDMRSEFVKNFPDDAMVVMLGAHHQRIIKPVVMRSWDGAPTQVKFRALSRSFGTYAWAVPRSRLRLLHDHYRQTLNQVRYDVVKTRKSTKPSLSPDKNMYEIIQANPSLAIYETVPLMVYHAEGFSNTWGKNRTESIHR